MTTTAMAQTAFAVVAFVIAPSARELQCFDASGECLHGGTCNVDRGDCTCPEGFTGKLCQCNIAEMTINL